LLKSGKEDRDELLGEAVAYGQMFNELVRELARIRNPGGQ
jgi:hypothetical protein